MAYARRDIVGGAPATTLATGVSSGDTTVVLGSGTGWPTGSNGDFFIVIDRGNAGEEKIRCASRSGTSITVQTAGRGSDGTSAAAHSAGVTVEHCITAIDADEANYAVSKTVAKATAVGQILVVDATNSFAAVQAKTSGQILVGNGTTVASVAVSGDATLASTGALSIGSSKITSAMIVDATIATGDIADSAITSAKIADGTIVAGDLASNAVTTAKITDANVTFAKFAATIRPITLSTSAPASPTTGDFWWDTDDYALKEYTTATTSWQPPWNLPWGLVASALASGQSGITTLTNVTGASVTFTGLAGRYYEIVALCQFTSTSGTPALQNFLVTDGSNVQVGNCQDITNLNIGSNGQTAKLTSDPRTAVGSTTWKLRFGRAGADTGTYRVDAGHIVVKDIGPAANPT